MNRLSITFQVEQLDLLLPVEPGSNNLRLPGSKRDIRRTSPLRQVGSKARNICTEKCLQCCSLFFFKIPSNYNKIAATAACLLISLAAAIGLWLFPVFLLHPFLWLLRTACRVCFLLLSKLNGCLLVTQCLDGLQCFRFELFDTFFTSFFYMTAWCHP